MTTQSNILDMIEKTQQSSVSGLFHELWNKGVKSQQQAPPLKLGDSEGSDFKRLLHRKEGTHKEPVRHRTISTGSSKSYHQNSPDFRPVVIINKESEPRSSRIMQLGTSLYGFLFQHEDRYFNHDREELSKDIFPVGYRQPL